MYFGPSYGFFSDFGIFGVIWLIFFLLIACFVVFFIVRAASEWRKNKNSPKLTVSAAVVSKRMDVGHRSTWYYVTFQVESGDRMELPVGGQEYGLLAEGDQGSLTFQGNRYLDFKRG